MNILIVATNHYSSPVPVMPVGACMVAEAAERAGHKVRVLDLMFEQNPLNTLESELNESNPDFIGLSVRNIDNNDMQHPVAFFKDLKPLMDTIRSKTPAPVALGGAAVSVMPEELLRYTGADCAVLGDGEVVFPKLLSALSQGENPGKIPGIAWLEDNVFTKNTGSVDRFSDGCLSPDFHRWIDVPAYLSRLSTVPIQTKLGCHFKCIYCTYRKIEGHDYRLRNPEAVIDVIQNLAAAGLHDIEFVDNVFNSPYDHALTICEGLARSQSGARLQSLELNPLFIDDTLLTAMERAGFVGIGITVESASDIVLDRLQKGFTAKDVYHAAQVIKRHNLPCLWIFMLGGPGESEVTIKETLCFSEQYLRPKDVAFFNIGIRIYPGTELEHRAREEGVLAISPSEMLEPVFYVSPALDLNWLTETMRQTMATHMNYINSNTIGLSFLPAMNRFGYRLGVKSPLWRHTRFIRRGLRTLGMDV
ncbi:MAG TPA: B12-binding domain-containing radical SAM protein [Candidatus Wunengus sp. YC63]|uniref:B12-binding domain-containing radical SAM protein n=1 Tax=unclassified Candidatus Wunengus TaxID=3367695 RepID=UPI0027128808|nr:cobalamin-dependent protein [Candidatus Brocadiales bacterium]